MCIVGGFGVWDVGASGSRGFTLCGVSAGFHEFLKQVRDPS